jgi:uncharacterized protein YqeY
MPRSYSVKRVAWNVSTSSPFMVESIKQRVETEVKTAMKAREKQRLGALRLIMAEFKNVEINERIELDDQRGLVILDKMTKQRSDSLKQFRDAGRDDLADIEALEIKVIEEFLPSKMTGDELEQLVAETVQKLGATSMQDMGKVMGSLKPEVQGRADMGQVSNLVKSRLA